MVKGENMTPGTLMFAKDKKAVYQITEILEDGSAKARVFVAEKGSAQEITIPSSGEGYGSMGDALNSLSPEAFAISAVMSSDVSNLESALVGLAKQIFKGEANEQQAADSSNGN